MLESKGAGPYTWTWGADHAVLAGRVLDFLAGSDVTGDVDVSGDMFDFKSGAVVTFESGVSVTLADGATFTRAGNMVRSTQNVLSGAQKSPGAERCSARNAAARTPGAGASRAPRRPRPAAAEFLRTSTDTLERLRARPDAGPPFERVGRRVLYPLAGLREYGRRK